MLRPSFFLLRVAGFAALLPVLAASGVVAQERVGVSGAVNPDVTGAPPGAATRQVVIGQDVVFNERITTGALGQTQLLFLDESAMTIGPNSDLTIDQFVYDPKSGTGQLAMSASRGLLRYVGGKLSKQEEGVSLRTSTATLAVRGGAFLLDLTTEGRMEAIFIYGRTLTVTGIGGVTETLRRPGYAISIAGPGGVPSAPFPAPPVRIAQLVGHLDGRAGASAGARSRSWSVISTAGSAPAPARGRCRAMRRWRAAASRRRFRAMSPAACSRRRNPSRSPRCKRSASARCSRALISARCRARARR